MEKPENGSQWQYGNWGVVTVTGWQGGYVVVRLEDDCPEAGLKRGQEQLQADDEFWEAAKPFIGRQQEWQNGQNSRNLTQRR